MTLNIIQFVTFSPFTTFIASHCACLLTTCWPNWIDGDHGDHGDHVDGGEDEEDDDGDHGATILDWNCFFLGWKEGGLTMVWRQGGWFVVVWHWFLVIALLRPENIIGKGRMASPKVMNFWKSSKRPLIPPPSFSENHVALFFRNTWPKKRL